MAPLALVGAGFATVTLSACYGPACATRVQLPDGGTKTLGTATSCVDTYDCNHSADGGTPDHDTVWESYCK